jgi:glycosyltransferase involved in cell wall biosynthesis
VSDQPTIGLALIVRNEAKSLPRLLESVAGAFDQVVLVDTGSKDKTVDIFRQWAEAQDLAQGFRVEHFDWVDDFAAARAYADSLLVTDWTCWADADDVIRGAEKLRMLAAEAQPELLGYVAGYDYAQDEHGNCCCHLRRERLVRRGAGTWQGRVHEAQSIPGLLSDVPAEVVEWVHRRDVGAPDSNKRNRRILRAWLEEEPDNARVLGYLGTEELARGKPKLAVRYFRRYLKLKTGWDEERAQIHRKYAIALAYEERYREAIALAFQAIELLPAWPDSYLTLAECYHQLGEWPKAEQWAREVLRLGTPQTLLIINPLDYILTPRLVLASALGGQMRIDEAIEVGEEALQMAPDHPQLLGAYTNWRAQRKREATAQTYLAAAQQLIAHDEQLKALTLLEQTVPHFARDHADVVALRSQLRERLAELTEPTAYRQHYTSGGSKPEDFVADEDVDKIGDALPRCGFLLDGLLEQAGVAA